MLPAAAGSAASACEGRAAGTSLRAGTGGSIGEAANGLAGDPVAACAGAVGCGARNDAVSSAADGIGDCPGNTGCRPAGVRRSLGGSGAEPEPALAPVEGAAVEAALGALRGCVVGDGTSENASAQRTLAPTAMIAPQTEQRARRFSRVTLAGSTRYTDWHSTHDTFMTDRSR